MTEIESDEPLVVIDEVEQAAARKFAESLIEEKCKHCVDFAKALAHTKCICDPILELIVAHKTTKGECDSIIAAWMTIQKVNREGK
jgi:hypothetical protein